MQQNYKALRNPGVNGKKANIHIGGRTRLQIDEINYFEADGNYTIAHLKSQKSIVVATTLGIIQSRSARLGNFLRPRRGLLINANYIDGYDFNQIVLKNSLNIIIPRRKRQEILNKLDALVG